MMMHTDDDGVCVLMMMHTHMMMSVCADDDAHTRVCGEKPAHMMMSVCTCRMHTHMMMVCVR
jgi:hypothetical protein